MSNILKVVMPQDGAWPYRILYWGREWVIVPGGPSTIREGSITVRAWPSDGVIRTARDLKIRDTVGTVTVLTYRGNWGDETEIPAK